VLSISAALLLDPLLDLLLGLALALVLLSRRRNTTGTRPARIRRRRDAHFRRWRARGRKASCERAPRWGLRLAWLVWGTFWLFATPRFSFWALGSLEVPPVDVAAALGDTPEDRCVMVVLSGGKVPPRPRAWGPELLAGSSFSRAVGAARVYRERPVGHVIVTGRAEPLGSPDDTAAAMADVMVAFGVPRERVIVEPLARDTRENALFSSAIARDLGAEKIVLVTSALHLPRALVELERTGLPVIGAPVDHRYEPPQGFDPYVPSTASFARMGQVLHELLGRLKP
jgi:uncharacterized SAM-binding protein YcdF (DUF218 family)